MSGQRLIVRGQVQGVGFRPTVWRLASELGLTGDVRNTDRGVEIRVWGEGHTNFAQKLQAELPILAQIDTVEHVSLSEPAPSEFKIRSSVEFGCMHCVVTPDAATCVDCLQEFRDPFADRYRYPFTNCTNCGPRFSIVDGAPYDRAKTTMRQFEMCDVCEHEYEEPNDRRFHAEPIACHSCGPRAWIEHLGGGAVHLESFSMLDNVDAAGGMLMNGHIVAIKGLGGFHLACDATKPDAVAKLRAKKQRHGKAFALMARDLDVVKRYADVSEKEAELLNAPQAPIILLKANGECLPNTNCTWP